VNPKPPSPTSSPGVPRAATGSTRERLLDATETLIARHGYEGTGVNTVLAASGVGNGSLYHHFPGGKDELVAASIERVGTTSRDQIEAALAGGSDAAIRSMFGFTSRRLVADEFAAGCRIATPLADASPEAEVVRLAAVAAFASWADVIADRLVVEGWDRDLARTTAGTLVALLQGGLLLARGEQSTRPLDDARDAALDLVAVRQPAR
jgi:TetR/AcrR family transcriptional regulator, lmrAB and yxaGH operons repressor